MKTPHFDDLFGDVAPEERARLRRAHDALVAAGPPPELSPALAAPPGRPQADVVQILPRGYPRRGLAAAAVLAAALALGAFGAGYLVGHDDEFAATRVVKMHGTASAPGALASIQLGTPDESGNWPMILTVQGLEPLPGRGYYELYLTRDGEPIGFCGTFDVEGGERQTKIRLSAAYNLERFDGWVVTKHVPPAEASDEPLLTT